MPRRRHKKPGKVAVIVPAAGSGRRMGGTRKQFRRLGGKPLLVQTLLVFERHPDVHQIYLAAPTDAVDVLRMELEADGLTKLRDVVAGGDTRQDSVHAALRIVPSDVEVVLVHDAVRPFVQANQLAVLIASARAEGGASLAIPVADTLRRGHDQQFRETVSREHLYRMQTPQAFRREWLTEAHQHAERLEIQATDDVDLVQAIGCAVQIVPGSSLNMKITTPGDWDLATILWPHWEASHENRTAPSTDEGAEA